MSCTFWIRRKRAAMLARQEQALEASLSGKTEKGNNPIEEAEKPLRKENKAVKKGAKKKGEAQ